MEYSLGKMQEGVDETLNRREKSNDGKGDWLGMSTTLRCPGDQDEEEAFVVMMAASGRRAA